MTCDVFGREVKVGDYVAAATLSYKHAHLRIGKVTSIGDAGYLSIKTVTKIRNPKSDGPRWYTDNSRSSGQFVRLDPSDVPLEAQRQIEIDLLPISKKEVPKVEPKVIGRSFVRFAPEDGRPQFQRLPDEML